MKFFFIFFLFLITACDEVNLKPKGDSACREETKAFNGVYTLDGKGGLFANAPWFSYDGVNHIVWPRYDIYAIKTPTRIYKMQIVGFYQPVTETPGYYTVQVQPHGGPVSRLTFEAQGCGNIYSNPNYEACSRDPNFNVATYLDLETLQTQKMTDEEAQVDTDWDISFKVSDVFLNSGTSGPSTVVGGVVQQMTLQCSGVFEENQITSGAEKAVSSFSGVPVPATVQYFLPDGVERVIYEGDWLIEVNGVRDVNSSYSWRVSTHDQRSSADVHLSDLRDVPVADGYSSQLDLSYVFENHTGVITLDVSTSQKLVSYCLNFGRGEVFKCSPQRTDWDIKFTGVNMFKDGKWSRDWRFYTAKGAIGPTVR